jgi:hypothetical protein
MGPFFNASGVSCRARAEEAALRRCRRLAPIPGSPVARALGDGRMRVCCDSGAEYTTARSPLSTLRSQSTLVCWTKLHGVFPAAGWEGYVDKHKRREPINHAKPGKWPVTGAG